MRRHLVLPVLLLVAACGTIDADTSVKHSDFSRNGVPTTTAATPRTATTLPLACSEVFRTGKKLDRAAAGLPCLVDGNLTVYGFGEIACPKGKAVKYNDLGYLGRDGLWHDYPKDQGASLRPDVATVC